MVLFCICLGGCSQEGGVQDNMIIETESKEQDNTESELTPETGIKTAENLFWVHFIDCGNADSALIQADGHYMLIDAGNKDDSRLIFSTLQSYSIEKIDIIIATHPHEDHIGGIPAALTVAPADMTLSPTEYDDSEHFKDYWKYAMLRGTKITIPQIGDVFNLGTATVEILGLNAGGDDENDSSIVCKVAYGDTSFLFTGDATTVAEQAILDTGMDLTATVLKVGHHGSDTSTGEEFLNKVNPHAAVISVGMNNEYGHPSESVLNRLKERGIKTFRTDLNGDIIIESDGKDWSVKCEKEASEEEIWKGRVFYQADENMSENGRNENVVRDYVANKRSFKLHFPECESLTNMKEENKLYLTGTREELINQGFEPCGGCRP